MRMFDTVLERPEFILLVSKGHRNIPAMLGNNWSIFLNIFFRGGSGAIVIYLFSMISIFCSRYDMNLIESALESQ